MAMRSASQLSLFHGIQIPNNGPSISHLFYANDALFQVIGLVLALSFWLRFLDASMSLSTLKVNFHKSRVFRIGVSNNEIVNCAHILSCEATSFPFVYLGVPVSANMSLKRNWKLIIECVHHKLSKGTLSPISFSFLL